MEGKLVVLPYKWATPWSNLEPPKGEVVLQMVVSDLSPDDMFGKRSRLWRPYKAELFGDKDVSHRVMSWAVDPLIEENPSPYDWTYSNSFHAHYWDGDMSITESWAGGFGSSKCDHHMEGYSFIYFAYCVYDRHDKLYLSDETSRPNTSYEIIWEWDRREQYGDVVKTWGDKIVVGYITTDGVIHPIQNITVYDHFVFKVDRTVPSRWVDHMDEIRPWTQNDGAALSEVIRNTIQEETGFNTNNFANVGEIIDLFNDFRKGKITELAKDFKETKRLIGNIGKNYSKSDLRKLSKKAKSGVANGWLKYRYAYNTTKADVQQFAKALLNDYLKEVTTDRVFRGKIDVTNGTMRVKFRMHENPSANFDRLLINMGKAGFFPGLYNMWDMIPFSFVVDWFVPVGDYLEDLDQSIFFRYYQVDELLVSVKQSVMIDELWGPTTYRWYDREVRDTWPSWEFYDDSGPSGKVITYRALDAASLVVG